MERDIVVKAFIAGNCVLVRVLPLKNALSGIAISADLLGIRISNNALHPTDLLVTIEELKS